MDLIMKLAETFKQQRGTFVNCCSSSWRHASSLLLNLAGTRENV